MLKANTLTEALQKQPLTREQTLLVILAVEVDTPKSVKEITRLGKTAGCPEVCNWNISAILQRARRLAVRLPEGWSLTSGGRDQVKSLCILPISTNLKVVNNAKQLQKEAAKISNGDTKAFVEEAIAAYEGGLYRSAVVLSWAGAVSLIYDRVMATCLTSFNAEAKRIHAKWKDAKIKDDLARMQEADFFDIIGCPPVSLIGKNLKEELKNNCLKLRNACGHPSSLRIGESKTSAHLEILILNVFSKF